MPRVLGITGIEAVGSKKWNEGAKRRFVRCSNNRWTKGLQALPVLEEGATYGDEEPHLNGIESHIWMGYGAIFGREKEPNLVVADSSSIKMK